MVATPTLRVVDHVGPCQHRIAQSLLSFPIHLQQDAARVRIPDSGGGVGVPGEGGTARAAARLVLRPIRTDRRIVGLLGLPGDDPVADVDLPRTRTGAVHAVRGPHHLVVTPAITVEDIACTAAFSEGHPTVVGFLPSSEELPELQERIRGLAIDPGGDRRIHELTISIGAGAAEVTISLSWTDLCPLTVFPECSSHYPLRWRITH